MLLPEPKPGLGRYDYLWTREAAVGRQQSKERPTCLVVPHNVGFIPPGLFAQIKALFLELSDQRQSTGVHR